MDHVQLQRREQDRERQLDRAARGRHAPEPRPLLLLLLLLLLLSIVLLLPLLQQLLAHELAHVVGGPRMGRRVRRPPNAETAPSPTAPVAARRRSALNSKEKTACEPRSPAITGDLRET